jgi:hypothetical protein
MKFKNIALLLLLPLAFAACDSGQPTYSASNASSAPPPPQAEPTPPPPPPPVAPAAQPAAPPTAPAARTDLPKPSQAPGYDSASRFAQVPAGKLGPVDKLGVGSCDDYIERYRKCFNDTTIARDQKFPLRRAFAQQLRQWKADAQAGRISQVAAACSDADKKARVEFSKVGCTSF